MATPLEVSVQRDEDGVPIVVAVGEIDMSNVGRLREVLAAAGDAAAGVAGGVGGGAGAFVVDLSGVEYLDSAGINALFEYMSRVRLIATSLLAPVLNVSGLGEIMSVREPSE